MRRTRLAGLGILLAATSSLALAAPLAFADITWTVANAGTPVRAVSTGPITFTDGDTTITCRSSTMSGSFPNAAKEANPLGTITAGPTFAGCVGTPGNLGFTVSVAPIENPVFGEAYNAGTQVTTGYIGNLNLSFSNLICKFSADGTPDTTADGEAAITYTTTTGSLKFTGAGNLVIYNVAGCPDFVDAGDGLDWSGAYSLTNSAGTFPQISSP
jgi:hypothetical protein